MDPTHVHVYVMPKLADAILGVHGQEVSHGGIFALNAVFHLMSLPPIYRPSPDIRRDEVVNNRIIETSFTTLPGRPIPLGHVKVLGGDGSAISHKSAIGVVTSKHPDGMIDHIFGVMRDFDRSAPTYANSDELIDQARISFGNVDDFYKFCFAILELEVF